MKRLVVMMVLAVLVGACGDGGNSDTTTTTESAASVTSTTTASAAIEPEPRTSDVRIASDGFELAGTLRLPTEDNAPGVVLIHGSGQQSRDATAAGQLNLVFGFEILIFAEIAEALQEAGFAVLTYDKRSCGPFNGCADNGYPLPTGVVIDDFISDASAGVDFLRSQPQIDPERVSVVGHSQGGEFITVMLQADTRLASGVMLAAPYRPIDELTEFQYTSTLELLDTLGMTEEEALRAPGVLDLGLIADGLRAIREGGSENVLGTDPLFWNSWFALGDAKLDAVSGSEQPVLILGGSYDWNVPASDAQSWSTLFADAGREHTTVVLDCVTHALNCVAQPDFMAITPDDLGDEVAPEVLEALISFLTES